MSTVAERVAAGVAYLDEHDPGWAERIDLGQLAMDESCRCVLAQLELALRGLGLEPAIAYAAACNRRGISIRREFDLGFIVGHPSETWDTLETEWRRVIAVRQQQTAVSA